MKRVFSAVLALTLLVCLAVPAFAAEFVGSIEAKPAPAVSKPAMTDKNGNTVEAKVETFSLADALAADPADVAAGELVKAYKEVKEGTAKLPEKDLVVSHIMEVHVDEAANDVLKTGGTIDLTFNLGVKDGTNVVAMTYNNGEWEKVKDCRNNGDGTVTATFAHFCPVAFATSDAPAKTGDSVGNSMVVWTSVLVLSAAAVVALIVVRRKNAKK